MTKGLKHYNFLNFCFVAKRQYVNSIVLGSLNQISHKLNISDYLCRTYMNYGLKNGLIVKIKGGYSFAKYEEIFKHIGLENSKLYSFCKFGNFQQLLERNTYAIARANFKQQAFNIKQKIKYFKIKQKIETGKYINKAEYRFYNKKCVQSVNKSIVTGQKHLSNLLGVSQGKAYKLLIRWVELGFITRKIAFSKNFDRFEDSRLLRLEIGNFICDGSVIKLLV